MSRIPTRGICIAVASWLVAGCSTPQPARDLASQGALVVDQAQVEVQGFVERATLAYLAREGVVRELAKSDLIDQSRTSFDVWLAAQTGQGSADRQRLELIHRVAAESRSMREKLEADLAARSTAISAAFGAAVPVPVDKMGAAKRAFANLAQELSAEDWLKFSFAYAKELNEDVKQLKAGKALAASSPAASAASAPAPAASAP